MKESIEDFDRINDQLFESSYQANRYANVLMPILGNLGNVSFVPNSLDRGTLCAKRRRWFNHWWSYGLSYNWNRSFTGPIAQVSQQLNFCPHGLGWWRSCL